MELKLTLMHEARSKGICADGYSQMRCRDNAELIEYYLLHPDWCMKRQFPPLELLREEFSGCEDKGIYVGRAFDGEVFDKLQTYIFHNCTGHIKVAMDYENAVIPMLYFANGCCMRVSCNQKQNLNSPIKVPVYVFGKNEVRTKSNAYAKFIRYKRRLL